MGTTEMLNLFAERSPLSSCAAISRVVNHLAITHQAYLLGSKKLPWHKSDQFSVFP